MPEHNPTHTVTSPDHDLLIRLDQNLTMVSRDISGIKDEQVRLREEQTMLREQQTKTATEVTSINKRLNGHVPEKCIRNDERLSGIETELHSYMECQKESADKQAESARFSWQTVLAAIALAVSIIATFREGFKRFFLGG